MQALECADRLCLTEVHDTPADADAFFPAIDPAVWHKESESSLETDPENGLQYSFAVYVRKT